jgi:L-2-hydroxyglutarate oxidase LhgO
MFDYIIIGSGIIGLAIARELKYRECDSRIAILEKEKDVEHHASGRNSGVLHSVHVLNAVSPAFTCSLSFANWLEC